MVTLSKQDIYKELVDENGYVTQNFRLFCEALRNKVNNTTAVSTSIVTTGDVFITATNIYFADNFWPLTSPSEQSVLQRDDSLAMSWQLPADITLAPETGKMELFLGDTAPSGWILFDGGTIGSSASSATLRANDDTEDLFEYLWDNFTDAQAPVSSGRGATAQADFDAGKTITLNDIDSRLLGIADSTNEHMDQAGADTIALTAANLPNHSHSAWFREPLDGGTVDPTAYALLHQDNLAKEGSYTMSIWTDDFEVANSRYDSETFENFDVKQPSFDCNIIIKL